MDYDEYKKAVDEAESGSAYEALAPYWERVRGIAESSDPWQQLGEDAISMTDTGDLVLATGGPHIELCQSGYLRGRWGKGWIFCLPRTAIEEDAARRVVDMIREIKG